MIKKSLIVERISPDSGTNESGVLSFVASTASEDRYGDVVSQSWSLDNYRSNPIVLLNHNSHELPIGRGDVEVVDEQLLIDITFDMEDPKAAEVARKAKAGFLNAVSVGFNPTRSIPRSELPEDHPAYGERGNYYERSELLEVSIVTIPANGEATSLAAKSFAEYGIPDLNLIKEIIDLRIQKREQELSLFRHISEVEELEDRFVVTYRKAKEEEEIEEEDTESFEEIEESYIEEDSEEEDKKKSLLSADKEILSYLLKIGDTNE